MIEYFAHSENNRNEKHKLSKHLLGTAGLAASFASRDDHRPLFRIAGLLHDLGKYQQAFQNYLINGGKRGTVPHAAWGAGFARLHKMPEVSIAIDGHHKGLPDNAAWKSDTEPFSRREIRGFEEVMNAFLRDTGTDFADIKGVAAFPLRHASAKLQREFFIRYLFSALTDSDWLSTEEHFDEEKFKSRAGELLQVDSLIAALEGKFANMPKEGELNRLRNDARNLAVGKARMPCGFYSLSLPTGMGKTLTSIAWALRHAKENNLRRIIIVLPYTNIIDQTALILKDIFGEDLVLEHHSSFHEENDGDCSENRPSSEARKRLACENWEFPIIVTTTVQFFESLFSNRPSRCRKIHNIAESVVIFDEVQTIPKEVISPTLQMLVDVHTIMSTSFLFCTATQPAFEQRQGFDGVGEIRPLIEAPADIFERTIRVEYRLLRDLEAVDVDGLLEAVVNMADSALVIFNTKRAALEFFKRTVGAGDWQVRYHLSTAMCPVHRRAVIKDINGSLKSKKKVLVACTQLIEAGVDLDFPVVFRAIAPLESIIQSAGRCNREGRLGVSGGKVILFKLLDSAMPDRTYAACAKYSEELISSGIDHLYDYVTFSRYYANVLRLYVDPDKFKINSARMGFNYDTVNDMYRIIDSASEGVFVYNYSDESRKLLHALEYKMSLSRDDYRNMQRFTVNVYRDFITKNASVCKLAMHGFRVWYGNYDGMTGISLDPLEADKSIV